MKSSIIFGILLSGIVLTSCRPQYADSYDASSLSSSGGIARGSLGVECARREVAPGQFQFSCDDLSRSNPAALTLRSEHVLWIQQDGGQQQTLDVLVPNYRIDELIKAGFKGTTDGATRVNILLKKPETTYNAEIGQRDASQSPPSVAVQYEPVQNVLVHYPNDKPYRPLSGPILPPA